jgi:hypothetical protein
MGNKSNCRSKRKLTKASQKKKIQQLESIYSARGILNFRNLQGNHTFASSSSLQQDGGLDVPGGEDLCPHFQEADDMQDGGHDRSLTPYCCRTSCIGDRAPPPSRNAPRLASSVEN